MRQVKVCDLFIKLLGKHVNSDVVFVGPKGNLSILLISQ